MMDDQVREASHSDELREPTKASRKHTKAPDGRGQRIDKPGARPQDADDGDAVADPEAHGSPGVKKSSS